MISRIVRRVCDTPSILQPIYRFVPFTVISYGIEGIWIALDELG